VVEDNGKSVCSDTLSIWGINDLTYSKEGIPKIIYYKYETKYPHAGSGKRIQF
jgi:pyruvate dehydrogenase E1 component alpha subunit